MTMRSLTFVYAILVSPTQNPVGDFINAHKPGIGIPKDKQQEVFEQFHRLYDLVSPPLYTLRSELTNWNYLACRRDWHWAIAC